MRDYEFNDTVELIEMWFMIPFELGYRFGMKLCGF